ncbi:MAG: leucine-rich repeat domain-containing protein [Clostridia bacterium]|nr:leucine-rich repeat domain-containing protein [Clostridia bacterium]
MKKRILSLIMALCLIALSCAVCTITASAAENGTCGNSLNWVLDEEGTLTISGEGDMDDWKSHLYVPWTYLDVKNIVVNEGVTSIGNYAFSYCINAQSVTISGTVTSIGTLSFNKCSGLSEIVIPDSVRSISSDTFDGCTGLTKITVGVGNERYMTDEYGILYNKEKTSLYKYPSASANKECILPSSLDNIHKNAFELCKNLESVKVEEGGWYYSSDTDGIVYNKNKDTLIMYPMGKKTEEYTVSDSVKTIAANAFANGENLKRLVIPEGITTIKERAFENNTGLESVKFPQSLTTIENVAFGNCTAIKAIELPDNLTTVGQGVFSGCSGIKSATLPKNMTSVNATMFKECTSLESIVIPDGVTSIGVNAFYNCKKLKSITLPNSLKEISQFCFQYCNSLTKVKYYGTSQEWQNSLYIDQGNNPLKNASREYAKFTKTTLGSDGKTYIVVTVNVPREKMVIMAFYKDGKLVDYDCDYDAYSDYKVYLKTNKEFDTAKVFVWDELENLTSLSETEYVYK